LPHFSLRFINRSTPCAVVEGRSRFTLQALFNDKRSIAPLAEFTTGARVAAHHTSQLALIAPNASGIVSITTAAPRTARFLGQVLHKDPTHFLVAGGQSAQGGHGQATLMVRNVEEVSCCSCSWVESRKVRKSASNTIMCI